MFAQQAGEHPAGRALIDALSSARSFAAMLRDDDPNPNPCKWSDQKKMGETPIFFSQPVSLLATGRRTRAMKKAARPATS
jgi:hypothetical protein